MAKQISVDISRVGMSGPRSPRPPPFVRETRAPPAVRTTVRRRWSPTCACARTAATTSRSPHVSGSSSSRMSGAGAKRRASCVRSIRWCSSTPSPTRERVAAAERSTGLHDAIVVGGAEIGEMPIALAVMDFTFLGGSMGSVVGEKFYPRRRAGDRPADAAGVGRRLGRRPYAGGRAVADADGQDRGGSGRAAGGGAALRSVLAHPTTAGSPRASPLSVTSSSPSPVRCSRSRDPGW